MPRVIEDVKLAFKDVLIRPKRSKIATRSEVDLDRTFVHPNSGRSWTGVPIIAANMDTVGTWEMAQTLAKHKMMTAIHKHYTPEEWVTWTTKCPEIVPYIAASSGTGENDFKKLTQIIGETKVTTICLDVANGYSEHFVDFVRKVRERFPDETIFAGNVVTGEMVEELVMSGADVVKVGIGPGSVCTTRKKTGVGYPQLSAVLECADAAHGLNAQIISDGGCGIPGDIVKAFGAGADYVMIGGMLAGHDESAGDVVTMNGKKFKEFYGMSSSVAMKKHSGGVAEYRSSEGKHVLVPYRGPVNTTVKDILGGIRSACAYVGARRLKHLSKCTTFIRVTMQTNEVFESLSHLAEDPKPPPALASASAEPASSSSTPPRKAEEPVDGSRQSKRAKVEE